MQNLFQKTVQKMFSKCFSFFHLFYSYHYIRYFIYCVSCDVMCVQYVQKQPPKVFFKKGVLKNFANFTEKDLCWSLFLIKIEA